MSWQKSNFMGLMLLMLLVSALAQATDSAETELPKALPEKPKFGSLLEASAKGANAAAAGNSKSIIRYPRISMLRAGKVPGQKGAAKLIQPKNLKDPSRPVDLKKDEVLTERARISTSAGNEVRIELDADSSVIVFENSELEIPVITWGEGEVLALRLLKGKIRISCEKACVRNFMTPISQNVFANGVLILEYRPELPEVELTTVRGGQDFRGLENEESVTLTPGQKVIFQGLKENGEVAFDVLLQGRKVARGKLLPVVTLKPEEIELLDSSTKDLKPPEVVKKKVIPRLPSQICDAPYGKLNECAWVCQGLTKKMTKKIKTCNLDIAGVSCQRRRCNANGEWGDATVLTKLNSRCEVQPVVSACDY